MSHQAHRALVVEDEPEAAADFVEILKSVWMQEATVVATNRRDAMRLLESTPFCIIILDLEIGSEPDSIRGRVENGKPFLQDARRRFPERSGGHDIFRRC